MKPIKLLTASAFAVAAGTLAASAGGFSEPAPAPVITEPVAMAPTGNDWTGGYAGLQLGYGQLNAGGADDNGILYGVQGGYDYDFGQFVMGGEIDYNRSDLDVGGGNSLDNMTRAKVRAGFDAGPALIYGTAGAAFGNATVGGASFSDTGYFFGAGVDYMLTDRFSVGAEITQNQFDEFDNSGVDIDATTAAVRVNMRF